jgi:hypothetical protein
MCGDQRRAGAAEKIEHDTLKAGRLDELMLHPTVKPVAMIADAIKDVSRRGGGDKNLFYGSTHQMPLFPGTGALSECGVGNIWNAPLRAGDGGAQFREAMKTRIFLVIQSKSGSSNRRSARGSPT